MSIAPAQSGPLPKAPQPPLFRRPALYVGLLGAVLIAVIGWRISGPRVDARVELPVMSTVPGFNFVDQTGADFSSQKLSGRLWVANFIFTRCPNICPRFTAKMATLQDKSASAVPGLELVSFTVDPENDTPEVLKAYADKHGANGARWHFLNGARPELEKVIRDGMMQPMDMGDGVDLNTVVHGSYFALVDGSMRVRGVYRFSEADAVDAVLRDAAILAR